MKDLVDLAKGVRYADDEEAYIAQQLHDITIECRSKDFKVKTEAIRKLTYLYLLGYDIKQCAFNTIECMSSSDFTVKKNGYFASYFSFGSPDMATLSTNLYVNDLKNKSESIKSIALSSLASCPSPNASQFNTLLPILFEQMNIIINSNQSVHILNKFLATITRFLVLAKSQGIDVDQAPQRFVDIIYNLASKNVVTADAMTTQIFAHIALEIAKNFGVEIVMKIVPQAFDILITAKQPWVLLDVVKFFAFVSKHDSRVNEKIGKHFYQLLQTTESKSLEMELCKAIAEGFGDTREMVLAAVVKMSSYVMPTKDVYTDENLKILAINNIGRLQQQQRGICGEVEGLTHVLVSLLEDVDFSVKIAVLEVIHGMANQQILKTIVNTLVQTLRDTKTQNTGLSIKDLHQVSPTDIASFKRRVVEVIVDICSESNYANVSDFSWLIDIFVTLMMDYPSVAADVVSSKLLDLTLKSSELRAITCKIMLLVLQNNNFKNTASLSTPNAKLSSLNLSGAVIPQESLSLVQEINLFNEVLSCAYATSQEQSVEIINAIVQKFWKMQDSGSQVQFLYEHFYRLMEQNACVPTKPQRQRAPMFVTDEKVIRADEIQSVHSVAQMLQICVWIVGICMQYQSIDENAARVDSVLDALTEGSISKYPADVISNYLIAAVRVYVSLLNSYENAFLSPKTATCFPRGWFSEVFVVPDVEGAAEFDPHASLVQTFAHCYGLLCQRLPTFIQTPELQQLVSALMRIVTIASKTLCRGAKVVRDEELRARILAQLEQAKEADDGVEGATEATLKSFITFNPEVQIALSHQVQHPAFAFQNGNIFSLDADANALMDDFDMFSYCPEEFSVQQKQRGKKQHKAAVIDAFDAFVDKPIEDDPFALQPTTDAFANQKVIHNEIEDVFAADEATPAVRNAFIIDKNKFQRKTDVQTNKYTAGLKISGLSIAKKPAEQPAAAPSTTQPGAPAETQQAEDAAAGERRRKKHKKHHDDEKEQCEEQQDEQTMPQGPGAAQNQQQEAPGEEPQKAEDDLMNLLL